MNGCADGRSAGFGASDLVHARADHNAELADRCALAAFIT